MGGAPQRNGADVAITVHSQHGHLPESLKELTAAKMAVLVKYLSTISAIDVELDKDGHASYLVRVKVATAGPVFRSRVVAEDPMAGIDIAVERLSRRLKEFKRKRSGRPLHANSSSNLRASNSRPAATTSIVSLAAEEPAGSQRDGLLDPSPGASES